MTQLKLFQLAGMTLALKTPDLIDSVSYGANVESIRPLSGIEDIVRDMQFRGQKNRDVKISMYLADMANYKADNLYQYISGGLAQSLCFNSGTLVITPIAVKKVKQQFFSGKQEQQSPNVL